MSPHPTARVARLAMVTDPNVEPLGSARRTNAVRSCLSGESNDGSDSRTSVACPMRTQGREGDFALLLLLVLVAIAWYVLFSYLGERETVSPRGSAILSWVATLGSALFVLLALVALLVSIS